MCDKTEENLHFKCNKTERKWFETCMACGGISARLFKCTYADTLHTHTFAQNPITKHDRQYNWNEYVLCNIEELLQ